MRTFALKRFMHQEVLKSIRPDRFLALLEPYAAYFARRGVVLAASQAGSRAAESVANYGGVAVRARERPALDCRELDYAGIAHVLMTPDETVPRELVEKLSLVDEMATREVMDVLYEEITRLPDDQRRRLDLGPDPTPADVAVMVLLHAPEILERKHAERLLVSKRSFYYYPPDRGDRPLLGLDDVRLQALEAAFDDAFDQMKRGRGAKVDVFDHADQVGLLVRRGDTCKREGVINADGPPSIYYRPEVFDVIKIDRGTSELKISAGQSKKIYDLYRQKIGLHLFGDPLLFPAGQAKFTLDPLATDGEDSLVCTDVDGMEHVVLREVHIVWSGRPRTFTIYKGDNLFEAWKPRTDHMLAAGTHIVKAKFAVKFSHTKPLRMVTVTNSNTSSFARHGEDAIVEEWLVQRGFALGADE